MKEDTIYVAHILDAIKDINEMTTGMDEDDFVENKPVRLAVVKSLEIIGEASKNISEEFRAKNPQIPWKDIIRMRDKTIHFYFGIDYSIVWQAVERDLPVLEAALKKSLSTKR